MVGNMTASIDSKEVGLVAGQNLLHFFLGTHDLHYGLWQNDLEVCVQNLPEAQRCYSNYLLSHIPGNVNRILDVGCGAGGIARELMSRGYHVEGVSPSRLLSEKAQQLAGDAFKIHHGRFEDVSFRADEKFDLVMFSESFQYINLHKGLEYAQRLLNRGGYVLISDFFKKNVAGRSPIGGGHSFDKFMSVLQESGLEILENKDITRETAPNFDLANQMERELLFPILDLAGHAFDQNYPWLAKVLRWKYRKKISKISKKYRGGERNAANFKHFKVYRFLLLRNPEH